MGGPAPEAPEGAFGNYLWGRFGNLRDCPCSQGDAGVVLVAPKGAGLSAMHEAFPHHEDLSCDSCEKWFSNQTFMNIKKKPVYNYLSADAKNVNILAQFFLHDVIYTKLSQNESTE